MTTTLPAADAAFLDRAEAEIRSLGRITSEAMLRIAAKLDEVRARIGAVRCVEWARDRFNWKEQSVYNMLRVANLRATNFVELSPDEIALIDVSAIYLLALPGTPDDVRDAAASDAKRGTRVSHGQVKKWLDDDGDDEPAAAPPADPMLAHLRPLVGALRQLATLQFEPAALVVVLEPDLRGVLAERVGAALDWLGRLETELAA